MNTVRTRQGGFTLIEVLLASSLLVLALIPLMRLLPMANRHQVDAEASTLSLLLAQDYLANLELQMAQNFDQNYSGTGSFAAPYKIHAYQVHDQMVGDAHDITVTVWADSDANGVLDTTEYGTTVETQYTRRMP